MAEKGKNVTRRLEKVSPRRWYLKCTLNAYKGSILGYLTEGQPKAEVYKGEMEIVE